MADNSNKKNSGSLFEKARLWVLDAMKPNDSKDKDKMVRLIIKTGQVDEYLTKIQCRKYGFNNKQITELIKASGRIEDFFSKDNMQAFGLTNENMVELIKASGKIKESLNKENIQIFGLKDKDIVELIKTSGDIEKYLTPEQCKEFRLSNVDIINLIKASGNKEKYFDLEEEEKFNEDYFLKRYGGYYCLIRKSENIEKYLTREQCKKYGVRLPDLIIASDKVDEFLEPDVIDEMKFSTDELRRLWNETSNWEKYFSKEYMNLIGYGDWSRAEILKDNKHLDKMLTPKLCNNLELNQLERTRLIKATGNIKKYLTLEQVTEFGIDEFDMYYLFSKDHSIAKYFNPTERKLYTAAYTRLDRKPLGEEEEVSWSDEFRIQYLKAFGDLEPYNIKKKQGETLKNKMYYALIMESGDIKKYLTQDQCKKYKFDNNLVRDLIVATGNIEEYLDNPQLCKELGLNSNNIAYLIKKTKNIDKYLNVEQCKELGLESNEVLDLIEASGNEEKYYKDENVKYPSGYYLLIRESGNIDEHLTPEECIELGLNEWEVKNLIKNSENIKEDVKLSYDRSGYALLISTKENMNQYLTREQCTKYGLKSWEIAALIKATGTIDKYLKKEYCEELGLQHGDIENLIIAKGDLEKIVRGEYNDFMVDKERIWDEVCHSMSYEERQQVYDKISREDIEIKKANELSQKNTTKQENKLTPLQQREKELSELEKEEKIISEAEALIDMQNEKEGQSIGDE